MEPSARVQKYVKNRTRVEAIQFNGENAGTIESWLKTNGGSMDVIEPFGGDGYQVIAIHSLEGHVEVGIGAYVVRGIAGEFYVCQGDIFESLHTTEDEARQDPVFRDPRSDPEPSGRSQCIIRVRFNGLVSATFVPADPDRGRQIGFFEMSHVLDYARTRINMEDVTAWCYESEIEQLIPLSLRY